MRSSVSVIFQTAWLCIIMSVCLGVSPVWIATAPSACLHLWAVMLQQMMPFSCSLPTEIPALQVCLHLKWIDLEKVLDFLCIFLGVAVNFLLFFHYQFMNGTTIKKTQKWDRGRSGCISGSDSFLLKVSFEQPVSYCHISGDLKHLFQSAAIVCVTNVSWTVLLKVSHAHLRTW